MSKIGTSGYELESSGRSVKTAGKKVCLFSDHHVSINPRLWKDAFFFEKLGFDVTIVTMWISAELRAKDFKLLKGHRINYKHYFNLIPGEVSKPASMYYRVRKRIASELVRFGIELPFAISYAPDLMYDFVVKEDADLYIAHLECAFHAGRKLLAAGKQVAFDFEDWYSRDYLVPGRPVRLLKQLEQNALENGLYCVAASASMAAALNKAYHSDKEITVIYNGFSVSETRHTIVRKINDSSNPALIWFSRNIGPDRGLETLFEAIALLERKVDLHLLGMSEPAYVDILRKKFPSDQGHALVIHDFIDHRELIPFLSGFDIGLAIEESQAESRQVTITNKILQYIQASLKVLATDTAGQQEVAAYFPDKFRVVPAKDPASWAAGINELIERKSETINVQKTFQEIFSWESQQKKYLQLLRNKKIYGSHHTEST